MRYFNWGYEKNKKLIKERNVSFEICLVKIENKDILDILDNSNYPNQKIFVLEIDSYVYLVPFIENKDEIFLKGKELDVIDEVWYNEKMHFALLSDYEGVALEKIRPCMLSANRDVSARSVTTLIGNA